MRKALLPGTRGAAADLALAQPTTVAALDAAIADCADAERAVKELRRALQMAEAHQAAARQRKTSCVKRVMNEAKAARAGAGRGEGLRTTSLRPSVNQPVDRVASDDRAQCE